MPTGWLRTIALGWVGGFLGSLAEGLWLSLYSIRSKDYRLPTKLRQAFGKFAYSYCTNIIHWWKKEGYYEYPSSCGFSPGH